MSSGLIPSVVGGAVTGEEAGTRRPTWSEQVIWVAGGTCSVDGRSSIDRLRVGAEGSRKWGRNERGKRISAGWVQHGGGGWQGTRVARVHQ